MTGQLITILVTVTVIAMMLRIGLDVDFAEVVASTRNRSLVARALLANYVFVPALTVTLSLVTHVSPIISAAFLILSVCPGAPFGPLLTAMAKGTVGVSVGLMVILAGSSAVLAPLLLRVLLRYVPGSGSLRFDVLNIFGTLVIDQLLPLSAGLAVRVWRPNLAAKLKKPFDVIANIFLLVTFLLVLVIHYKGLIEVRLIGFLLFEVLALIVPVARAMYSATSSGICTRSLSAFFWRMAILVSRSGIWISAISPHSKRERKRSSMEEIFFRRAVGRNYDLLLLVVERVKSVEELFLGALGAGDELDVVNSVRRTHLEDQRTLFCKLNALSGSRIAISDHPQRGATSASYESFAHVLI